MILKIDTEFDGTVSSNFYHNARNSQNWDFDSILLPKVENV